MTTKDISETTVRNDVQPPAQKSETPDDKIDRETCFFNRGVKCVHAETAPNSQCRRCGWNPEEAERRKAKLRAKYS